MGVKLFKSDKDLLLKQKHLHLYYSSSQLSAKGRLHKFYKKYKTD